MIRTPTILLTAALSLTIGAMTATTYANSLLLTPSKTQLEWQGWTITINRLAFEKTIKQSHGDARMPDSDSEFVYLDVTVKNSSHQGQSFVPQNDVKIMVGEDAFDAEDIDSNYDYVKNIEPTLARRRECYFELPKAILKDAFLLRFSRLFTDAADVPVSIAVSDLTDDDQTRKDNDIELSKIPTPASKAFSVATPEAIPASLQLPDNIEQLPAPIYPPTSNPNKSSVSFIVALSRAFDNHDWQTITNYTMSGSVNYFGHLRASNAFIRQDMQGDARAYASDRSIVYPETFTHEVSDEYSSRWDGPMIYDSITVHTEALENNGHLHKARTRLTVGYTVQDQHISIYALVLKVL